MTGPWFGSARVVAVGVGLLLAFVGSAGCSINLDPTDDSNYASVSFLNNTPQNPELFECQTDGAQCHSEGFIPPGTSLKQEVAFGDFTSVFQVRRRGQPAAWLVLSLPRHTEGSVYWLSDATASKIIVSPDHGQPHLKPTP